MSTSKIYEFHSRHDLEKVHVLRLFSTAPLLVIRMQRFFHQTTHRYLFTPEKWSDRHSEVIHWLWKFRVKTNSTAPLQLVSQLIQCIHCDPINVCKSCDAFVQVTDQFKHNYEQFTFESRRTLLRHSKSSHRRFNAFIVIQLTSVIVVMHSFKSQINSNIIVNNLFFEK